MYCYVFMHLKRVTYLSRHGSQNEKKNEKQKRVHLRHIPKQDYTNDKQQGQNTSSCTLEATRLLMWKTTPTRATGPLLPRHAFVKLVPSMENTAVTCWSLPHKSPTQWHSKLGQDKKKPRSKVTGTVEGSLGWAQSSGFCHWIIITNYYMTAH